MLLHCVERFVARIVYYLLTPVEYGLRALAIPFFAVERFFFHAAEEVEKLADKLVED